MKPLYRALLPRDMILGLPRSFLIFVVAVTIVIAGSISRLWPAIVAVFLCGILRILTKTDEYLIEISTAMMMEPNRLEV